MSGTSIAAAAAVGLGLGQALAATLAHTDRNGRIRALDLLGESVEIRTDLRIPTQGWKKIPNLDTAKGVKATHGDGAWKWAGTVEPEPGQPFRFEQTLRQDAGEVRLSLRVACEGDVKVEGVYFWLDLPIALFGGGTCELSDGSAAKTAQMPPERPASRHFLAANARRAEFAAPSGKPTLAVAVNPACHVTVQDNREWNTPTYSALVRFPVAQWQKGTTAMLEVTLRLAGEADQSPATLTLDASKARYRLDGFGGNYCFGIESPVSHYTLDNLRVAWARTEMTLSEWKPQNDNAPPEANDQPDTNLRREFLLTQEIQRKGIPYVISIWHLPEWLYTDPGKGPAAFGRRFAPERWPEVLECIGSYLLYAKKQYGVEPDLFSFNEPDGGVRVKFSAEEHRDAIKRIGAHFEKLGLKTRMLLADVCHARGTHTYALPAANDPEALRYVGGLSFHSWGGAKPEEYAAWSDLADKLKVPLLVAELGVDAWAWRGAAYNTFDYALREVRMYQELVLHARPRGTMQWEFTSDYGTVRVEKDGTLVPTVRFWFVKHFCNLTPPKADVLATSSDNPKVLLTAFRGEGPVYTLHIASFGAAREATIAGLPPEVKSLRAVQTSAADSFKELPAVPVEAGAARVQLAQQSLLTLTTMPAGAGIPDSR
ncbi:MAG: hypothetical protein FJ290_17635 [Planctomycetes bacterium]|nr:hypothetical protein [Planctomycetota bacterium]